MSEPELVDAYLDGKIVTWTFVRRLLKAGLTVSTALAFTALLPAAALGGELTALDQLVEKTKKKDPHEAKVLERLVGRLARGLVRLEAGGSDAALERSLVRLGINVVNQGFRNADLNMNEDVRNVPVNISGNVSCGKPNVNAAGKAAGKARLAQSCDVNVNGMVGNAGVVLEGAISVNVNGRPGPKGVQLRIGGNVGDTKINFNAQGPVNEQ